MIERIALISVVAIFAGACAPPPSRTAGGVVASDEPRIWVVREVHTANQIVGEVYRCADGAPVDQPPKPICVKAPMGD